MGGAPSCDDFDEGSQDFLTCTMGALNADAYIKKYAPTSDWETILKSYWEFQKDCKTNAYDPNTPLFCQRKPYFPDDRLVWVQSVDDWAKGPIPYMRCSYQNGQCFGTPEGPGVSTFGDGPQRSAMRGWAFNDNMLNYYMATRFRIEKVCPGYFESVWPEFYHLYNSANGKAQVDRWIAANPNAPSSCVNALKSNFTNESQQKYGLLNEPDPKSGFDPYSQQNSGFSQSLLGGGGFKYINPQSPDLDTMYLRKTTEDSVFKGHYFGNPLWSRADRLQALSRALGKDVTTEQEFLTSWAQSYVDQGVLNPGGNTLDYFNPEVTHGKDSTITNSLYSGKLPYAPNYLVGNEPWHKDTSDPDNYGYDNPCDQMGALDGVMPIIGAVVAGGFAMLIVPGTRAKFIGAATAGSAGYFLVQNVYGWQATLQLYGSWPTIAGTKEYAAKILSIGAPVTVVVSALDLDVLPAVMTSTYGQLASVGGAAGLGYLLLYPLLEPLLAIGGGVVTGLLSPIAAIERGILILTNGCLSHLSLSSDTCKCENANSKPLIINAIADQVLGTTGAQNRLRRQCLSAAMTTGTWGTDPKKIGTCNLQNGSVSTKSACQPASVWVYPQYQHGDPQGQAMFNEVAHCMSADNLSMLPPRTIDADCVKSYGEYFRNDGSGKCKDFRAPPGLQDPGMYDFETIKINESCTIL